MAASHTTVDGDHGRVERWKALTASLRDELLNAGVFNTFAEAKLLIEQWRVHRNRVRPHSSLGYRPPAPEVAVSGMAMLPGNPGPTRSHQPPCCT